MRPFIFRSFQTLYPKLVGGVVIFQIMILSLIIFSSSTEQGQNDNQKQPHVIDSLTQEVYKRDSIIQDFMYAERVCITAESNIIALGEDYHARVGVEAIPHVDLTNIFVVIDSVGDAFLNDTIRIRNKQLLFNFRPNKKGLYKLKGRFIYLGRRTEEEYFTTNFKVE